MRPATLFTLLVLSSMVAPAGVRDRSVDPIHGDRRNDGYSAPSTGDGRNPVKSIHRGIRESEYSGPKSNEVR